MITFWQIKSMNLANTKLLGMIGDPRVIAPLRVLCLEHGTPYYEGDPRKTFINLYEVVSCKTYEPSSPGIPQDPAIIRGQNESHEQSTCESLAASILDSIGIEFRK